MVQRTLEAPVPQPRPSQAQTPGAVARRRTWWIVAIAVALAGAALVTWARTRPGFDPYGWLVWGHQTLTGSLDTNAAPSWKPLPYVFTVVFALAGHSAELRLWMIASTALSLAGVVFAGRIAWRLTDAPPQRRWAGYVAAAFAGAALLSLNDYFHYILSSQSDPVIVSLCLAAIDFHLQGRPRVAFLLGLLAALGRPEAWAFLGLYSLWAWRARPAMRRLLVAGWVALALLWFGIPALTARTPFVSAANAFDSGRRLTSDQFGGTIRRFLDLTPLPLKLAALLGVALAAWRRRSCDRITLALAGGVLLWVAVEIAFALHGWPGLERYMFEAGAVMLVLSGAGVGRLLADPPSLPGVPRWAGPAVVGLLVVACVSPALSAARAEHRDLREQRKRTRVLQRLDTIVAELGGAARLRGCGEPLTRLEYQTALAFALRDNVSQVGFKYAQAIAHGNPIILFTPYPVGVGWTVQAMHQVKASCRSLP